jgi:uncharacterized repeat protein (TIGR04076 family)
MSKFKVEIEKILERGICPFGFKAGDSFVFEDQGVPQTFPNFCAWAFHEMTPALHLKYGGRFPGNQAGVARISARSKNPVVLKLPCWPRAASQKYA